MSSSFRRISDVQYIAHRRGIQGLWRFVQGRTLCAIWCMPIPSGGSSVDRSLLRDDVYRRLRDAIVDGTFLPGEQLKDGELAEWLGVSRTPVREALLRLAASGLVVALPGRSTTVSAIDAPMVRDARDGVAAVH